MLAKESFPVEKVSFADLYPLNFEEFLNNTSEGMLSEAFDALHSAENPSPVVHNKLWELLKQYYVVGGMPRAVQAFIERVRNGCHANRIDYALLRTSTPLDVALSAYLANRAQKA